MHKQIPGIFVICNSLLVC